MKRIKKLLAVILTGCLITSLSLTTFAAELSQDTEEVIGTYSTEEEKQEAIDQILTENPNALIFTNEDEYEQFLAALASPESITIANETRTRAAEASYHISVNTTGISKVNVYYSYYTLKGGFVGSIKNNSWYSNYTGVTIGNDYFQDLLTVVKASSTNIKTTLAYHIDHYILISGLIKVGSSAKKYTFDHNVQTGKVTMQTIY